MKKIKLLILPSDHFGVGHYRSIWPAQEIQKNHSSEFEVDIRLHEGVTDADIGKFDIVHFHRRIGVHEETQGWINKLRAGGAILVCDMDDYWMPFHGHPVRDLVVKQNVHNQILNAGKDSDWVTTTTEIFAKHIRKHANKNVHIIPNAIDPSLKMWQRDESTHERVRVAWIGGSSHERDLDKLKGTFNKLLSDPEVKNKIQIVMCGYDTRGSITEIHPVTKEQKTRPITPEESVWNKFEAIFNDNGRATAEQYVRRNTLPITQYGKHYNFCDICLAPLEEHTFNECKSELKIIETGMMRKALIASNLYVYNQLLTHGENALLVDPNKNHKLWFKYIKQLVLDDDMRNELSNNLYNLVNPKYTLESVTNDRCAFYKNIVEARTKE